MDSNRYLFSDNAKKDLDNILNYISNVLFNPKAAEIFLMSLTKKIELLCLFPKMGKMVDNKFVIKETKRINIDNYCLLYNYDSNNKIIYIYRIIYQKMDIDREIKKGSHMWTIFLTYLSLSKRLDFRFRNKLGTSQ